MISHHNLNVQLIKKDYTSHPIVEQKTKVVLFQIITIFLIGYLLVNIGIVTLHLIMNII